MTYAEWLKSLRVMRGQWAERACASVKVENPRTLAELFGR